MGIFSSIKNAIFGDDKDDKKPDLTPGIGGSKSADATTVVNVEDRLAAKPGADKLNWRTSIVDLMKLLGIDSSYENRKQLAEELGRKDYEGTAEDNIWLHKRTMREIANNGGNVPASMLD